MTSEHVSILEPKKRSTRRAVADHSAQIAEDVEKRSSDIVKCRRVFDNCYRCNWWAPDYGDTAVITYRIRQSKLLRVIKTPDGLTMTDETIRRPKVNTGLAQFLR